MNLSQYRNAMHAQHDWTQRAQENRCRAQTPWSEFTKTPLSVVGVNWRDEHLAYAKARHHRAQAKSSVCVPTTNAGIIRYVFPSYAEDQAIRVAAAESTGDCYGGDGYSLYAGAKNPDSTASGLFQLLDSWWSGRNPGYPAINPFDPLANTRAAYRLWYTSGQSFAGHWAASIGCWS